MAASLLNQLFEDFLTWLQVEWTLPESLASAAESAILGCSTSLLRDPDVRKNHLFAVVNSKLKLNRSRLQKFLDAAALRKIFPNYHEKAEILRLLDYGDVEALKQWLEERSYDPTLRHSLEPTSDAETISALHEQLKSGAVARRDARKVDPSERRDEVLRSLFGSYIFHCFPPRGMHTHFNSDCRVDYFEDFYEHLLRFHPSVLHRDCALIFLVIDDRIRSTTTHEELRDQLCAFIRDAYKQLSNHCFFAILIKPFTDNGESGEWRLFSDLILYAEKHREIDVGNGYFQKDEIERATADHIREINLDSAKLALANEGFLFRDCFILLPKTGADSIRTSSAQSELLLLFEKNERDETLIPCPACRSFDVRGNSYPSLGVRSWECQNPICPNRSAFDRGNRYSLSAIIKQEAIDSERDQIPEGSLKKWKLDVVLNVTEQDVVDMLLRHFTLCGDRVLFINDHDDRSLAYGRTITHESFPQTLHARGINENFQSGAYFKRFVVEREARPDTLIKRILTPFSALEVFQGDCFEALASRATGSIDGAVTSPPYYNARSYAVWPNIYCYLYDMYNHARQVYRVLRPGAIYLFNIFDYFDNENNIVSSAMGKKRMILGAYIINLFRRVGFRLEGNVVWYKGEIEGKRNFNQGNRSPYYQFPLNCWEHVLTFRKQGEITRPYSFPTVLASKPVIKMVRGRNILGHSAPFPTSIPDLLLSQLQPGETVLDPYSGSMTTGRLAYRRGLKSVSIELHEEYCQLGLRLLEEEIKNLELFAS